MPYYFGEDMEEYDDYIDKIEADPDYEVPASQYIYVQPWQANAAVLSFPETPGPEPEMPRWPAYGQPANKFGFFARLFGQRADAAPETSQPAPEETLESYTKQQEAACAHELWKVSRWAARCRDLALKRVFGTYDGGGDESFTHFLGIEMRDGRVIHADLIGGEAKGVDCKQLVEDAVSALMGSYGAGGFELYGAVIIDFDACTVTDEKNIDIVFGDKNPWEV
jgi:hypothetical protein